MICFITNYNLDDEARAIYDQCAPHCETHILDSSGIDKGFVMSEPYGNLKKGAEIFLNSKHDMALFICSDVRGNFRRIIQRVKNLTPNIGLYTPAVEGCSHDFLKPVSYTVRDIPFCEGMILAVNRDIIQNIKHVVDKSFNGWGLDIYKGFICKNLGYRCVCDDGVHVYHPFGTSYDKKKAKRAMKEFMGEMGSEFRKFCHKNGIGLPLYRRYLKRLASCFRQ